MARYAIEETTLTALGDVIRSKVGETREVYIDTISVVAEKDLSNSSSSNLVYIYQARKEVPEISFVKVKLLQTNNDIKWFMVSQLTAMNGTATKDEKLIFDENNEAISTINFTTPYINVGVAVQGGYDYHIEFEYAFYDANGDIIPMPTGEFIKNTMTPMEMAEKINGLDNLPDEAFNITGNCQYRFANGGWDWFINFYGSKITTSDIVNGLSMFSGATEIKVIPFEINFKKDYNYHSLSNMFQNNYKLKEAPKINNAIPYDMDHFFYGCNNIRYLPEDIGEWFDWSYQEKQTSGYSCSKAYIFANCFSLRKVPMGLLKRANPKITYSYSQFYNAFQNCSSLDELVGLPIPYDATWTSNTFNSTFDNCRRLKEITFEVQEDGSPLVKDWTKQTIDLTKNVGYYDHSSSEWNTNTIKAGIDASYVVKYNSGITADKVIYDDATYAALKDDPDAFCLNNSKNKGAYSRYNHDSAVNTINSLPDCSAKGGNTIKFTGAAGSKTDGGAINTLTEAEIAVATAKGWTVSLV